MKKSDIFNKKMPCPTDRYMIPVWKRFEALKKEIAFNWQQDIIQQRIGLRGFIDLKDIRMDTDINKEGEVTPVLRLRPVIGNEVQQELEFYILLFKLYKTYVDEIVSVIEGGLTVKSFVKKMNTKGGMKAWDKTTRPHIHSLIIILKMVTSAAFEEKLTKNHLDLMVNEPTTETINELIAKWGYTQSMPDGFATGDDFFLNPDEDMAGAFWKYSTKVVTANKKTDHQNLCREIEM